MALPGTLDTTIAHKAICLSTDLSAAEKTVAAAIIDHFNRRTGQCDPGVERLARLTGLAQRTILRAVDRLDDLGLIQKVRHGGKGNRNDYAPQWLRFRELDAAWSVRFNGDRNPAAKTALSPASRQDGQVSDDVAVTQTIPINHLNEPALEGSRHEPDRFRARCGQNGSAEKKKGEVHNRSRRWTPPSSEVASVEAERRWTRDVHQEFCSSPQAYGAVIEAIGAALSAAATSAEAKQRGAGLRCILRALAGGGGIQTLQRSDTGPASGLQSHKAEIEYGKPTP